MQQEIRQTIIDMFNLSDLSDERQEEMVLKLGELVFESSLARAFDAMEEADRIELEAKLDENIAPNAFLDLVKQKTPDFQTIITEELQELKKQADLVTAA